MIRWPATCPSIAIATSTDPGPRSGWGRVGWPTRRTTKSSPPTITLRPSTVPSTPSPGISATSVGTGRSSPRARAAATTACATGWGEACSSAAARRSRSSGPGLPGVSIATIRGRPSVRVPVLSRISVRARAIASSGRAPLMRMPKRAARDSPATSATGTARISGQGVATTSTATARTGSPLIHQASSASATVRPRKPSDQRSASRDIGAFECWAASTRRTMPA